MHKSQNYWENPEAFQPSRFLPNGQGHNNLRAFLPFSSGPRACVGASFALFEATFLLARILKRYEFSLESDSQIEPEPGLSLRPKKGVWGRVTPRP